MFWDSLHVQENDWPVLNQLGFYKPALIQNLSTSKKSLRYISRCWNTTLLLVYPGLQNWPWKI